MSFDRIRERLERPPATTWRPRQPGDWVMGRVLEIQESGKERRDGSRWPVLTLETHEGEEVEVHCMEAMLESRARTLRVGDEIGIRYQGEMAGGYKGFKIVVEEGSSAPGD